jgi:CBS-domain-containing membrane protein
MSVQYTIPSDNQLFLTTIKASHATLKNTSKLMYDHRTRSCLVVDEKNVLVGLVTARKIIKAMCFGENANLNIATPSKRSDNQSDRATTPYMIPPAKLLVTPPNLTEAQNKQLQRKMDHLHIVYVPVVNGDHEITDVLTQIDVLRSGSAPSDEIHQILKESLESLID